LEIREHDKDVIPYIDKGKDLEIREQENDVVPYTDHGQGKEY
jgi:hypothetical protein